MPGKFSRPFKIVPDDFVAGMTRKWDGSESKPTKRLLFGHYFEIMFHRNAYYHRVNRQHYIILLAVTNAKPDKSPQGERIFGH